ncbi:MAG: type I secretion C-terminal target domain-containing protein [Geminicoccaceae bacterium]
MTQVSDTLIELDGLASIDAYQQVINAASIGIDLQNPQFGERQIEVGVTDPDGLTGTGTTSVDVQNNLLTGPGDGSGNDTIIGTAPGDGQSGDDVISGRAGDDTIYGMGGNDFIDGGEGNDLIDVSQPGMNTVIGGPGVDQIILGPEADIVRITGLSDGADTISLFNATEGDKLDLQELFRDSDITAGTIADYIQTTAIADGVKVQVDLDGKGSGASFVDIAYLQDPTGARGRRGPVELRDHPGRRIDGGLKPTNQSREGRPWCRPFPFLPVASLFIGRRAVAPQHGHAGATLVALMSRPKVVRQTAACDGHLAE